MVRIPTGPLGSLKCDPLKGNADQKKTRKEKALAVQEGFEQVQQARLRPGAASIPLFFSFQRLHGFRRVVQHVWSMLQLGLKA